MFKFGLEKEYFIFKNGIITEIPENSKLPFDESGYLAEARGKPADNITDAVYLLMAEIYRISSIAKTEGLELFDYPIYTISNSMHNRIRRRFAKGTNSYQNLYGYETHRNRITQGTAGIHISVTNQGEYQRNSNGNYYTEYYNKLWDFPQFFMYLDDKFAQEIIDSKRNPGFYEIKTDGRIEYRSLPSSASLDKIIEVVKSYKFGG